MFTLPNLPYDYAALEPFIDERTMRIHHDKHHGTYVKNLNDALVGNESLLAMPVEELIKDLSVVPEDIRTKVRNNAGGHANHTMFWECMAPASAKNHEPSALLMNAINETFGSFPAFTEKFTASGVGRFGSGWVWLVSEGKTLHIVDTQNQDSPLMEAVSAGSQRKTPILCLDVWEHAYYLKYQNMRAEYIKAWWNVVNWAEVEKRFAASVV